MRDTVNITKNQGNHSMDEKRQSTDAHTKMNQSLGLSDKGFKAVKKKKCYHNLLEILKKNILAKKGGS